MANTIENTTDEALLRSIINGTIEELEDDTITTLPDRALSHLYDKDGIRHLRKLYLPNVTTVGTYALAGSIGSNTDIYLDASVFPKLENGGANAFSELGVKRVNLPEWTGGTVVNTAQGSRFRGMSNVETIVFRKCIIYNYADSNESASLKSVCLGNNTDYNGTKHIASLAFNGCPKLDTLVLYGNSLYVLDNINGITSSCFGSSKSGGKLYVPQSMIETYTNATNWSNIIAYTNNQILPIEGSEYEHYYCDGTPLYMSNTSGLIAYYDVGNADDWDGTTKFLTSHIDCDFKAYRCNSRYSDINTNNPPDIPTTFYDEYANCGLGIYFGDIISNITDVLTLEFLFAANRDVLNFNTENALDGYAGSQVTGYVSNSPNLRIFRHIVLEIKEGEGFKVYCDKELKMTNTSKTSVLSDVDSFRIIQNNNSYLGHVSVWNRALTEDEIAEHYQYYVDNFHVGETAFDSSGNFIAE